MTPSHACQTCARWACLATHVLCCPALVTAEPFSIIVLPDTQNYHLIEPADEIFSVQTQWIADHVQVDGNPRQIRFVTHLGDVVSEGSSLEQWQRAKLAMSKLDGVAPYAVDAGNHDFVETSAKDSGATQFISFFGPQAFTGLTWYLGADPSGMNSGQVFSGGGYSFLHLALEWQPALNLPLRDPSPLSWAQGLIDAHPQMPVILSTHEYVNNNPAGRSEAGQALWEEFIRRNDQIFLVLNGHFHHGGSVFDGNYHQVSINDYGHEVYEVLQNYQDYSSGGDGWLRLIEFDIEQNRLYFQTYSPWLDAYQLLTEEQYGPYASQFEFSIDFADRFDFSIPGAGDFDRNGVVDGRDFVYWQRSESLRANSTEDLLEWQANYGLPAAPNSASVPEPKITALFGFGLLTVGLRLRVFFPIS